MKNLFAFILVLLGFLIMPGISFAQQAYVPGVDPAIQQVVTEALPAKYTSYGTAIILGIMILGRFFKAMADGRGIKGWISAIINGTNGNGPRILIATLCLLSLPACSTPEQNQRLGQLVTLAVELAEKRGAITATDAAAIRAAETIILPPTSPLPAIDVTSGK